MKTVNEQRALVEAEIRKLEQMGGTFTGKAKLFRDSTFQRFPVILLLLSTFGVVAVLYGFEKVIDQIDFMANNPLFILGIGIGTLALTGSLYKKLT